MATKRTASSRAKGGASDVEHTPPEKKVRRSTRRSTRLQEKEEEEETKVVTTRAPTPAKKAAAVKKTTKAKAKKSEVVEKKTKGKDENKVAAKPKASSREVIRVQATDVAEPQSTSDSETTVVYLGHIPHGFYEHQIRDYFSQFGDVLKVRVSRSKASGKSKGYAFLEFESSEVAKIAAETMHDYLMFGQKLVCKLIPLEELHPHTFKGANQRFKKIPWRKIESERHNKERSKSEENKRQKRLAAKDAKRRKKIEAAGIDYDFSGYSSGKKKESATATKTKVARKKTAVTKKAAAAKPTPKKAPARASTRTTRSRK
jgi:nucleolar protein 15